MMVKLLLNITRDVVVSNLAQYTGIIYSNTNKK